MKEIVNKLDSYNIFNYLLPGALFLAYIKISFDIEISTEKIVLDLFVCYFIGLVISRIGSLILDKKIQNFPIGKDEDGKIKRFISFSDYGDYIEAEKKNPKITLLSETNNTYRTLCSLFFVIVIISIGAIINSYSNYISYLKEYSLGLGLIISIGLFLLFVFSYKKQSGYINKRVKKALEEAPSEKVDEASSD